MHANIQKIRKTDEDRLNIELQKNIDIISSLAREFPDKRFMGFCAETERVEEHAKLKLIKKGLDFIVANDVSKSDIGFDSDYNEVSVFTDNSHQFFHKASKSLLAIQLVNLLSKDNQSLH